MENEEKEVFTAEDIKEQSYEEIIKDVIEEIDSREENLKIYYPYFVINKKLQDEKTEIDLNSVFVAILSYLLYTGKLNNRKIEYQDIVDFTEYFIYKIYNKKQENVKEIVNKILDVAQNNGNNFTYEYYSLKEKENKDRHIKYIEIKLGENGKLNYYITPQGIDFYLKTKEFPDSAQITINLLLFRKQIEKGSFNYAYDTIKRLNIEVKKKSEQKELVLEALMYGGKEGIEEYNKYHESVEGQINEEEELFGEVLELVDNIYNEYLAKNESNQLNEKEKQTISLIKKIEKELNKTINSHTKLLKEAIEMTKKHDEIIGMRARSAFSEKFKFEQEFEKVISKTNNPEKLFYFISPFLLPKKLKSFNPMKSLESQKINQDKKEEEQKEKSQTHQIDTIDDITKKRVVHNFKFYFENMLFLLKTRKSFDLKEYSEFIRSNYGEKSLYNGDFISFVIFLNGKKELTAESDEMFKDYSFNQIIIITQNDDIDFGNGLKITNIIISANS